MPLLVPDLAPVPVTRVVVAAALRCGCADRVVVEARHVRALTPTLERLDAISRDATVSTGAACEQCGYVYDRPAAAVAYFPSEIDLPSTPDRPSRVGAGGGEEGDEQYEALLLNVLGFAADVDDVPEGAASDGPVGDGDLPEEARLAVIDKQTFFGGLYQKVVITR